MKTFIAILLIFWTVPDFVIVLFKNKNDAANLCNIMNKNAEKESLWLLTAPGVYAACDIRGLK